jgi:hypothetical protein
MGVRCAEDAYGTGRRRFDHCAHVQLFDSKPHGVMRVSLGVRQASWPLFLRRVGRTLLRYTSTSSDKQPADTASSEQWAKFLHQTFILYDGPHSALKWSDDRSVP